MPKKQLLPPSSESNRREVSVNLRFSLEDHTRLKKVAEFSNTTVANLLFYVTMNTTLPLMEQEVQRATKTETNLPQSSTPPITIPNTGKALLIPEHNQEQP